MRIVKTSVYILFIFSALTCFSQQKFFLEIKHLKPDRELEKINYSKSFISKTDLQKELRNYLLQVYDRAYLAASFDSIQQDSSHTIAYLNSGAIYKWARLRKGNVDEGILSEVHFRERLFDEKPLYYKDVKKLQEKILVYCENNGYPFASVRLDSIAISENQISASLNLNKNMMVKIDTIEIKGNAKISRVFMQNYLGIKPGMLYNEKPVKQIGKRIKELAFLKEAKPAEVIFSDKAAKIILYPSKKPSSQFDGIIGLLPDNKTGKVLFTGDVRLRLQNALAHGELLDLNWRRLQVQTQDLKVRAVYPYVFSTTLGIDYAFKLYKKDTTYIDVDQNIGIQYLLTGGNYFKVYVNNKSSSLLSTKGLQFQTTLPEHADIRSTVYGIGIKEERLDYRFNPRKGFSLTLNTGAGSKRIKKNQALKQEIYDTLKLNSVQYNADLESAVFIPFFERNTIKAGFMGAFLQADNVFQNELYRIGGLKSLRGFDEESILASSYGILSLEYRYLLEQNSYMFLFFDQGYYEKKTIRETIHDTPYGFGTGISFETKAGIFSLQYALGSQFNNPIQFRTGKIHFGIVNYF